MSGKINRNSSGQFASGQSGNPAGARLRRPKELLTDTDMHRIVLEVASEVVAAQGSRPVTGLWPVGRDVGGAVSGLPLRRRR